MTTALRNSIARLGHKLDEHKKDAVPMKAALDSLVPYARQARTEFDAEALGELANSIKEIGVVEPLLVRPMGGGQYEIVAGERRMRAARIAGLVEVPVLVRPMDDATADKVHLAENIHRENLSTLDLAQRVQLDLDDAGGDLAAVAAKYSKSKPWVSKLSAIAQGGESMAELVSDGVTADRAVLATVSSLERKAPDRAKALSEELRVAPGKANKRVIAEKFMQSERAGKTKAGDANNAAHKAAKTPKWLEDQRKADLQRRALEESSWRGQKSIARDVGQASITVELSPMSAFAAEFAELSTQFGAARLAISVRHPEPAYAVVQFGDDAAHQRTYRADELRLLAVW